MIITCNDSAMAECSSALLVPEIAEQEPGYIKALTSSSAAASKHEFHALAQMAYYQHQDDEIKVTPLTGLCRIRRGNDDDVLESGLIIYRSLDGTIHIASHQGVNSKKLLEVANRYCTRWVRLDI